MKKLIITLALVLPVLMMAQPGMPNNPTPVDGMIGLLAAAGVTYGIREYRRRNRQK